MSLKVTLNHSLLLRLSQGILRHLRASALGILPLLALAIAPAWASLGQPEASVTTDQLHMKSEDRVQRFQSYRMHELTTENGAIVREYVSPEGLVFGITWHGRFMPDVNQLLGTYANNLQIATPDQTQIRRHRGITVKTSDFVYSNFCHGRICQGTTYLPKLIPNNVPVEAIR